MKCEPYACVSRDTNGFGWLDHDKCGAKSMKALRLQTQRKIGDSARRISKRSET